jgi:hypothetical protein
LLFLLLATARYFGTAYFGENMTSFSAKSLTGVWQGLYSYPGQGEPVSFVATLIETGSFVCGTTHETCSVTDASKQNLHAMISGVRHDASVTFTKSYDGTAGWKHKVEYDGALNSEASEVEGRWNIDGILAGRFMMIRNPGKEVAVERKVFERV